MTELWPGARVLVRVPEPPRVVVETTSIGLAAEIARATAREDALQAELDQEETDRAAGDAALSTALGLETTARQNADTLEATTRANADTTLQANITAEAALARNADNLTSGTVADARLPGRLSDATLAATYASGTDTGLARFVRAMHRPTRDLYVIAPGDSTHLQTDPWIVKLFRDHIGPAYPAWTINYDKWDGATDTLNSTVVLQSGTGSFTIHILNLSYSGRTTFYYTTGARWTQYLAYGACDLLIYSQGWNEPSSKDLFSPRYMASLEALRTVYPTAEVLVVAENAGGSPLSGATIDGQATRAESVRAVAAYRGYALLDAHDLFVSNPTYAADWLQADGTHPNDAGMTAIANRAYQLFTFPTTGTVVPKSIEPPAFTVPDNLLQYGDLSGWDGTGLPPGASTSVGPCTVTKDTGIYETNGYSIKIVGTGSATSYLPFDVPASVFPRCKYGYVTLAARVYVPSGQSHNNAGRVGIDIVNDGHSNVQTNGLSSEGLDGWQWRAVRIYVDSSGSRVRGRIYANLSSDSTGGVVYLDRLSIVQGVIPHETTPQRSLTQNITTPTTGFGYPYTVDPQNLRGSDSQVFTANRAFFMRVRDGGTVSKIAMIVATSSGNIDVGVYSNSGSGRSAVPGTKLASSGSVACPSAASGGYAEVSLGTSVTVQPGDWLAVSADNATAAIRCILSGYITNGMGAGRAYIRDSSFPLPGSNPTSLQATVGPSAVLVGVA